MHMSGSPTYLLYRYIYIHMQHILHSSCSKSTARPATNRRKAMRRAEANAKWGALHFEIQMLASPLVRHHIVSIITTLTVELLMILLPFTLAPHHRTTTRTIARPLLDFLDLILILLLTAGGGGGGGSGGGGIGVGIGFRTINDVTLLQHRPRRRQR